MWRRAPLLASLLLRPPSGDAAWSAFATGYLELAGVSRAVRTMLLSPLLLLIRERLLPFAEGQGSGAVSGIQAALAA